MNDTVVVKNDEEEANVRQSGKDCSRFIRLSGPAGAGDSRPFGFVRKVVKKEKRY